MRNESVIRLVLAEVNTNLTLLVRIGGSGAEYAMDMHQKEQLHDNGMSMMQSQHFSVSGPTHE